MLIKILILILFTFVPVLELRWSIPIGLFSGVIKGVPLIGSIEGFGLPLLLVFFVCVLANILLGLIAYFFFHKIIHFFLRISLFKKFYDFLIVRAQKKVFPFVEKYGLIGMAFFIAIPLPGSGSWTGAIAANLLGYGYKKFFVANTIGVIIAGILVTFISLGFFSFI